MVETLRLYLLILEPLYLISALVLCGVLLLCARGPLRERDFARSARWANVGGFVLLVLALGCALLRWVLL